MRRIDGERRQQRKHVGQKIVFEPGFFRPGDVLTVDQNDAGIAEQAA